MIYLIDGHNLLHKFKNLKDRIYSDHLYVRDYLITTINQYFKTRVNSQVYLYFDNKKQTMNLRQKIRGVHIRYSRPDETADDLIKSEIQKFKHLNDRIIVVSDDRSIINYVQGGNIYTKSSTEFHKSIINKDINNKYPKVGSTKAESTELSDSEVDKWMEFFGESDENETDL